MNNNFIIEPICINELMGIKIKKLIYNNIKNKYPMISFNEESLIIKFIVDKNFIDNAINIFKDIKNDLTIEFIHKNFKFGKYKSITMYVKEDLNIHASWKFDDLKNEYIEEHLNYAIKNNIMLLSSMIFIPNIFTFHYSLLKNFNGVVLFHCIDNEYNNIVKISNNKFKKTFKKVNECNDINQFLVEFTYYENIMNLLKVFTYKEDKEQKNITFYII